MKTYFIVETNAEGWTYGKTVQNLEKLLSDIGVVWEEEWEEEDKFGLETPRIIIKSAPSNKNIKVFRISDKLGYQEMIAEFNFFGDFQDDLEDFISEFYREIITSTNESLNIKKFNDFNQPSIPSKSN